MLGVKILLCIILLFSVLSVLNPLETFYSSYPFDSGWGFGSYINIPSRSTRNQSYDIRGDPVVIHPNPYLSPWGMSTMF